MNLRGTLLLVLLIELTFGCSSFKSTLIERDPSNLGYQSARFKGYPITLKVPTHIRVEIVNRRYMDKEGNVLSYKNGEQVVTQNFKTFVIETDKIFTCDYKRPASGGAKTNTAFTKDGYIDSIQFSANDDTITQSGIAMQRFLTNLSGGTLSDSTAVKTAENFLTKPDITGRSPNERNKPLDSYVIAPYGKTHEEAEFATNDPDYSNKYDVIEEIIATELFDLDDPEYEIKISSFITSYCLK